MSRNRKRVMTLSVLLGITVLIVVISAIYNGFQKETYMSEDPLFGSFSIENGDQFDTIHPADFLVSIDVELSNETLEKCAEKENIDISEGCWVYSFDENRIFEAEKRENKLLIYEDNEVIGTLDYSYKKFLWITYNETYSLDWKGRQMELKKILQGFIFP